MIKPVVPADAGRIHALLVRITSEDFDFPQEALQSYWNDWSAEVIGKRCQNTSQVLLAVWEEAEPVGLLLGTPPEGGVATIIWLLVGTRHANRGLGARLFTEAVARYKSIGAHKLKLTAPSDRAKSFYTRQGMEVEGFHPEHWWKRDFWALGMRLDK